MYKSKEAVLAAIADGSIFNNVMPPLAERIAIRDAKLAADRERGRAWCAEHPHTETAQRAQVRDPDIYGYNTRHYHGD